MGNNKGRYWRDERLSRRMSSISAIDHKKLCKKCGQVKSGKSFYNGSAPDLCAICDPKIFYCKSCAKYKESLRFSKATRQSGENICYLCSGNYKYTQRKGYISKPTKEASKVRKCLRCDKDFKSKGNMRRCAPCKAATKHVE